MKIFEQMTIVIVIVFFIIFLEIFTTRNTANSINKMLDEIDKISDLLDIDIIKAKQESKNIYEKWEKLENKMNYYLEHDELEKVGRQITILQSQIKSENILDIKQNLSEIKFLLKHIEEKPKITVDNIF